jgi:hypothetical protein
LIDIEGPYPVLAFINANQSIGKRSGNGAPLSSKEKGVKLHAG